MKIFLVFLFLASFSELSFSIKRTIDSNPSSIIPLQTRLKSTETTNLGRKEWKLPTTFSCTCGVYVPICELIFAAIESKFSVAISAKVNAKNGPGEYFEAKYTQKYSLENMIKRIESENLKNLATKLGLNTIQLENAMLTVTLGTKSGAKFAATISYLGKYNLALQLTFVKDLHMTLWAGLSLKYGEMLDTLATVSGKAIDAESKKSFDALGGAEFLMLIQTGPIDFTNIPEIKPQLPWPDKEMDRLTSSKVALILYAKVEIGTGSSKVLKWLQDHLKVNTLNLFARIQMDEFYLEASLDKISLFGGKAELQNPGLYFKFPYANPHLLEFGIKTTLVVNLDSSKKLTFDGAVMITPVAVGFKFVMREIWTEAFGLSRLSFGRVLLELRISYTGIPSTLQLGGELAIGKSCYDQKGNFVGKDHCLHVQSYVGLDMTNLANNFFYFKSESRLNLQTIATALMGTKESPIEVPEILKRAFEIQDGMVIAFSPAKKVDFEFTTYDESLPPDQQKKTKVTINQGFLFKGTVTLLSVKAELTLNIKTDPSDLGFLGEINVLAPIKFGNVLVISDAQGSKGPMFGLGIEKKNGVSLKVSAKVAIMDFISVSTELQFNKTHFSFAFNAQGNYMPFMVALEVQAEYEKMSINTFHIKGKVVKNPNQKSLNELVTAVGETLKGAAKALWEKLQAAGKYMVEGVQTGWNKVKGWWSSLKSFFGGFQQRFKANKVNNQADMEYISGFVDMLIKTDRVRAEKIANLYHKGKIKVFFDIREFSFALDYDDKAECEKGEHKLSITVKFEATIFDKVISKEGTINFSDLGVSVLAWTLQQVTKIELTE